MTDLGNPKHTIEVIQKYQFAFQKRFGQSFLIDTRALDKIVGAIGIAEQGRVLEVGPGIGTMTQYLAEHARRVVVMEIDSNLLPVLNETLEGYMSITVINDDILRMGVGSLVNECNERRSVKMMTNLPYYIITPITMGLFESDVPVDNITVIVQKEVADRMQVGPESKDYGALSLVVQYYAEPYIVANIPPNYFIPGSNVDSTVIRLTRYKEPPVQVDNPKFMFKLVRVSFNQRRKALQNRLNNSPEIPCDRGMIARAIESLGVQSTIRGEALNLGQFAQLSNYFIRNV